MDLRGLIEIKKEKKERKIIMLNHVFVMNVAMIQPLNGYSEYYFALDSFIVELCRYLIL